MSTDSILAELLEIEAVLSDDRLADEDRYALHGAQQALPAILEPDTWQTPSQTFYQIGARPVQAGKALH